MKKLYSLLLLIFSCLQHANSQSLFVDSTRFVTGVNCCTSIEYAIPTADNGILFLGTDNKNPQGIIPSFLLDTVDLNVFIGKLDADKHISWLKIFGGTNNEEPASVVQTTDGGYAVVATTESANGDVAGFHGIEDIWLLRLDAMGNLLWQKCFGSATGGSGAMSIANCSDHGFIISGATNGSDGDVPIHYGPALSLDWLVIKTDSLGNKQWSKDIGGTGNEQFAGSILAVDSFYYLISSSNSTDHDCYDSSWHVGVNTGYDYHVLKLNDTGKVIWDSSYGGSGDDFCQNAIWDARDSSIVMTGEGESNDFMETDQHGEGDMLTIKTDRNGKIKWCHSVGGPSIDVGMSLLNAPDNGYVLLGNTQPYPDTMSGDIGGQDCWLLMLDNTGSVFCKKVFGGTSIDLPYSIVPCLDGYAAVGNSGSNVFTEGTTYGNFDEDALNPGGGGGFISYIGYEPLIVNNIINSDKQLSVYPNPTASSSKVILPTINSGTACVLNGIGQIVLEQQLYQVQNFELNTENWNAGLYLIKWQGEDGNVLVAKLIKK